MHTAQYSFQDQSDNEIGHLFQTADGTQIVSLDTLHSFIFNDVKYTFNGNDYTSGEYFGREYQTNDGEKLIRFRKTDVNNNGYWVNELDETIAPCRDCLLDNISTGSFSEFSTNPVIETENGRITLIEQGWVVSDGVQIVTSPDADPTTTGSVGEVKVQVKRGDWTHGIRTFSEKTSAVNEYGNKKVFDRADSILFIGKNLESCFLENASLGRVINSINGEISINTDMILSSYIEDSESGLDNTIYDKPKIENNEYLYDVPFADEWFKRSKRALTISSYFGVTNYDELTLAKIQEIKNSFESEFATLSTKFVQARFGAIILNLDDPSAGMTQQIIEDLADNFRSVFQIRELPIIHTETFGNVDLEYDEKQEIVPKTGLDLVNYPDINIVIESVSEYTSQNIFISFYTEENGWSEDWEDSEVQDANASELWPSDVITKIYFRGYDNYQDNIFIIDDVTQDTINEKEYLQTIYGKLPKLTRYFTPDLSTQANFDREDPFNQTDVTWDFRTGAISIVPIDGQLQLVWNHEEILTLDYIGSFEDSEPLVEEIGKLTKSGKEELSRRWARISRPYLIRSLKLDDFDVVANWSADEGVQKDENNNVTRWENLSAYGSTYDLRLKVTATYRIDATRNITKTFIENGPKYYADGWLDTPMLAFHQDDGPNAMMSPFNPFFLESAYSGSDFDAPIESFDIFFTYRLKAKVNTNTDGTTIFYVGQGREFGSRILAHAPWTNGRAIFYTEDSATIPPTGWNPVQSDKNFAYYGERMILHFGFRSGVESFIRKNGVVLATKPQGTINTSSKSVFYLGGAFTYQAMDLAEVAVFRGGNLSEGNIKEIEGYFANRWQMNYVLPDDHPYKF